jgi:hypothetical protein
MIDLKLITLILMSILTPIAFLIEIKVMYELLLFLFPLNNSCAGMFSILLSLTSIISILFYYI